jgi:transportin-3
MAANGAQQAFAPVLAAHSTMSSGADRAQKEQAHQYLEQFQKSVWQDNPHERGVVG